MVRSLIGGNNIPDDTHLYASLGFVWVISRFSADYDLVVHPTRYVYIYKIYSTIPVTIYVHVRTAVKSYRRQNIQHMVKHLVTLSMQRPHTQHKAHKAHIHVLRSRQVERMKTCAQQPISNDIGVSPS